ncbi:MAG TPA: dephospho-CoA kinase [Burkholderiaceae bacterium]
MLPSSPRFTVGLTGGIGSGKSTVTDLFAAQGVTIIDTDQIAHAITAPNGLAMPAIAAQFGSEFVTQSGAMDRDKMRQLVFSDPAMRVRLEAILHPLIRQETEAAADLATGPYTIFAVPLLVESGSWRQRVARVLVVDCAESTQVARVVARNNMSEAQVRAIMATQAPRAARLAAADDVMQNEGDLPALEAQVELLHTRYCQLAKQMR